MSKSGRLYLRPCGILAAEQANANILNFADGRLACSMIELIRKTEHSISRKVRSLGRCRPDPAVRPKMQAFRNALQRPRPPLAGLALDRPRLMGVINVTPDSFSDGGAFLELAQAIAHGELLCQQGADILDIGGESTRPGARPVSPDEEKRRVLPIIRHFANQGILVSVDTSKAEVMRAALDHGARIINDVSGLTADPNSSEVAVSSGAWVILMHMQGSPQTMQHHPGYQDVVTDIFDWFARRIECCVSAGIDLSRIAVDPGIGFGKTLEHNLALMRRASLFQTLGVAVVYGLSRKSFIGQLHPRSSPQQRLAGSLAAGLAVLDQGAQILRVHDVEETAQARAVWEALHPHSSPQD